MEKTEVYLDLNNWESLNKLDNMTTVKTKVAILKQFLPKKTAAYEVYKYLRMNKVSGFAQIFAVFIVAVGGAFSIYASAISAGIFSVLGAFYVRKAVMRMKDLETTYNINPNAK